MSYNPLTPVPTPETEAFWQGLRENVLRLCHCDTCQQYYFPPSNVCGHCASKAVSWVEASGDASLYSYVINHRPAPEWQSDGPMSVALVQLAEGPRLVSTVVNCPQTPEALRLDMPLQAVFYKRSDDETLTHLCFEPADGSAIATTSEGGAV